MHSIRVRRIGYNRAMKRVSALGGVLALGLAALGFKAPAALKWEPLCEPGNGGRIVCVKASPCNPRHIVAMGDMLGGAVSFDGAESWQCTMGLNTYEMASVTFHPSRSNEVWTSSCSGPYVSYDGGRNWQSRRNGMPEPCSWRYSAIVEKILFDKTTPRRMYAFGGSARRWTENYRRRDLEKNIPENGENMAKESSC